MTGQKPILVTGATGYIGGRLAPRLLEQGHRVRVLARSRERVLSRPWAGQVEVAVGDALDPGSLAEAIGGSGIRLLPDPQPLHRFRLP